jgi:outer membrane biosynthesis protein TonB
MSIPPVIRSLVAISAFATVCSTPVISKAGEQNPLVVVGLSPEAVAIACPTPTYPADCERMRIQGRVEVSIWVQNGKMVKVKGLSANPLLAGKSARWIHRNWQFKPSTTGVYVLPIIYELDGSGTSS